MSFGFSVGDVIFCTKLAFSVYLSLKEAPKEFEGLRLEVLSLNTTLRALAEEANSPNSIILLASPQRQESLRVLLENCSKGLEQLQALTRKFPTLGSNEKIKFLEHVKFSLQNKNGPRDKLAIHTASINIFLTSLTHSSLGRLEGLIKNALRGSQQRQQSVQAQFPNAGYETIGTKSFAAFTQDFGGQPQPVSAKPSDVWTSIAQDLQWERIQEADVRPLKDEVVAYIRYLHNGGEPFWKRGASKVEQESLKHGRNLQNAQSRDRYSDHSYRQEYEARPQPQAPPAFNQAPPAYSPPSSASQYGGYGAPPSQSGTRPPSQRPVLGTPPFNIGSAPLTSNPSSNAPESRRNDGRNSTFSLGRANDAAPSKPATTAGNTLSEERMRLEALKLTETKVKQDEFKETLTASGASLPTLDTPQSQPSPKPFGQAGSNQTSGGRFGVSNASNLASSRPSTNNTSITSGSLFGSISVTAPPTSGASLFGGLPNASPSEQPSTVKPASSLFGGGSQNLFGQPNVDQREINEMVDLFDHMFDVDEAETAIAQGAQVETSYPPSPQYASAAIDQSPSSISVNNVSPSGNPDAFADPPSSTSAASHAIAMSNQRFRERYPLPPPITADTPVELRRARLRDVKGQLESLLDRIFQAYRSGDTATPVMLVHPSPQNNGESPVRDRVAYLRSAGVIVVNCDICSTPVPDYHWHCDICAGGDWDCCFKCRSSGRGCPGNHGYLQRRSARQWEKERYWTNL
jgi:hypothetical protein